MATDRFKLSIRELLFLVTILGLVLALVLRNTYRPTTPESKALISVNEPLKYRYWHKRGDEGSGTGQIGSGNEWKQANGIDVYDNFIIVHLPDGLDQMVDREGLQWFDWQPLASSAAPIPKIKTGTGRANH